MMQPVAADTLHGLVLSVGRAHGARVAVTFDAGGARGSESESESLSYSELLSAAERLSGLLRARGPPEERLFGLYCEPGLRVPAWILGILQVPAAYVPLDPEGAPVQSVRVMEQSGLNYCVVQRHLVQRFNARFSSLVSMEVCAEWQSEDITLFRIHRGAAAQQPGHEGVPLSLLSAAQSHLAGQQGLAYVLHTSGTTGWPKTVRVPHECIVPNIIHIRSLFQVTAEDIIFMASPLTFDPSVVDMFVALSSGARLLIVPTITKRNPNKLAATLFKKHQNTILQATPTLVCKFGRRVLRELVLSAHSPLRVLALGGEPCPSLAVLRSWRQEGNRTRVFNLYGTTETSCWSCCYEVPQEQLLATATGELSVPLGTPLMGTAVEVRDETGRVLTEGEGQVYTGGERRVCLLGGEVTVAAGTMRATGDWVDLRDSQLFYMGRKDCLVKRNGQRLYLDAVHHALESLPQVDACAVILCEGRLLAFVVSDFHGTDILSSRALQGDILRSLSHLLPAHGIPDSLIMLPFLPLTAHGKVSTDKLLKVYQKRRTVSLGTLADGRAVLQELRALWREALGLADDADVSSDANFLLSGGDSLQCLRLLDAITFSMDLDPTKLLEVLLNSSFSDVVSCVTTALFSKERRKSAPSADQGSPAHIFSLEPDKVPPTQPLSPESSREHPTKVLNSCSKQRPSLPSSKRPSSPGAFPERAKRLAAARRRPMGFVMLRRAGEVVEVGLSVLSLKSEDNAVLGRAPSHTTAQRDRVGAAELSLRVRWTSDTGRCVDASPVLLVTRVDNTLDRTEATVYIGSHSHRLQALDFSTGNLRWERVLGGRIESSVAVTRCGGFVVVGCYDGNVYFVCADTGDTHWVFGTGDAVKSCPTADPLSGLIIVGSHDGHIYALDLEDCCCTWKRSCGSGGVFSSPCLHPSQRQLYVATLGGRLLSLNTVSVTPTRTPAVSCGHIPERCPFSRLPAASAAVCALALWTAASAASATRATRCGTSPQTHPFSRPHVPCHALPTRGLHVARMTAACTAWTVLLGCWCGDLGQRGGSSRAHWPSTAPLGAAGPWWHSAPRTECCGFWTERTDP
ncbi:beta-alanine-activating enzyme isoform X1 [Scleropages formosus]|uniref:beta-alanine-activating enzyme isoform X1 n=1 Tax=Scleropages formosus TaxID=113540 RepID=UPI0008780249|nr:beta-alanine-activating enzyme isoform X1 [Scleropages formosus]